MLNNYLIYFYQPSKESGIPNLTPQGRIVLGILTIIGLIKAIGHIIQYDTVTTGINQEGIFGAARSFIVKMGNSLAIMIVPSLVVTGAAAGENVGAPGLKLTAVAGSLFCLLAVFVFLRYREKDVLAAIAAGEMLGTGCTFKNISSDDDGSCRAQAFLRCINDADFEKDLDTLRKMAARHGVQIVLRDEDNEYYTPTSLDSRGYQYVKETAQAVFPYTAVAPFILPAGTDARRFTDLSDAVIRFVPIDIDDQQYASVHGENENISIDKLPIAVDFYKQLLRNYA